MSTEQTGKHRLQVARHYTVWHGRINYGYSQVQNLAGTPVEDSEHVLGEELLLNSLPVSSCSIPCFN